MIKKTTFTRHVCGVYMWPYIDFYFFPPLLYCKPFKGSVHIAFFSITQAKMLLVVSKYF